MVCFRLLLFTVLFILSTPVFAQEGTFDAMSAATDPDYVPEPLRPITAQLHPVAGKISLANGMITLDLPPGMGYLPPDQTKFLLNKVSGFPGDVKGLGSVISTAHPIGSNASWYALIGYDETGHIDDSTIPDDNMLMVQLLQDNERRNQKIIDMGLRYLAVTLFGWAEKPSLNISAHTLSWAIETKGVSDDNSSIIYNLRVLGRKGVLSLNIVCSAEQVPMLEEETLKLLRATHFEAPNRYADFNPDTDKQAPYKVDYLITEHMEKAAPAAEKTAARNKARTILEMQGSLILMVLAALVLRARLKRKK